MANFTITASFDNIHELLTYSALLAGGLEFRAQLQDEPELDEEECGRCNAKAAPKEPTLADYIVEALSGRHALRTLAGVNDFLVSEGVNPVSQDTLVANLQSAGVEFVTRLRRSDNVWLVGLAVRN
jgi:hypothetical protein